MKMYYPCVEIDLKKITHNTKEIINICETKDIHVVGVSKVFCARKPVVQAMLEGGIEIIGDSRIENLKKIEVLKCKKMLLRIPMESCASEVVKYSDISLNSEIGIIRQLSRAAKRANKLHFVILMVDLGDLREGILKEEVISTVKEINLLPNIRLYGLGTNLTCYGGIIPDSKNLGELVAISQDIKKVLNLNLPVLSGGNSSSLHAVLNGSIPKGINQLRIGEAIVLGRETAYGKPINNTYSDAFILKGEIVEIKYKPSVPIGRIGMDAFGQTPKFNDKGIIKRAIVAVGRQDIIPEGLTSRDCSLEILGASSDHLLINISKAEKKYKIGDVVEFNMDYGCLLRAMTSPYVRVYYK